MINSLDAARAICEFGKWQVSNLVLHKILYIAHGSYMAKKGGADSPLIEGYFQSWDYGPVEPSLYRKFKLFGAGSIKEYALTMKYQTAAPDESKDEVKHIKDVFEHLVSFTPPELIAVTHVSGGAWAKAYEPQMSSIIDNIDIYNEYKNY